MGGTYPQANELQRLTMTTVERLCAEADPMEQDSLR